MPPKLKPLAALLTGCLMTGCATQGAVTADSGCKSFLPISMSKKDTNETKRQIIGHNRAYDAICPKGGAHG